jgi:hypothetical protein
MKNLNNMKSGGCYKCGGKVKMYNQGGTMMSDVDGYLYNPLAFMQEGGMPPEEMMMQEGMSPEMGGGQGMSQEEQLLMAVAQILMEQGDQAAMQFLQEQGFSPDESMEVLQAAAEYAEQMQGGAPAEGQMSPEEEQMMMEQMASQDGMMRYGGLMKFINGGSQNCPEGTVYDPSTGGCVQSGIPYAEGQGTYYSFGQDPDNDAAMTAGLGARQAGSFDEYVTQRIAEDELQIEDPEVAAAVRASKEKFRDQNSRMFTSAEDADRITAEEAGRAQRQTQTQNGYTITHKNRLDMQQPDLRDLRMAYLSGLGSPSNPYTAALKAAGRKGVSTGLSALSLVGSVHQGIRKFTGDDVVEKYDAMGNRIAKNGGEWNPFEDNRKRFRVGMPVYQGAGTVANKPASYEEWLMMNNLGQGMSEGDDFTEEYNQYLKSFSESNPEVATLDKEMVIARGDSAGTLAGINTLNALTDISSFFDERDTSRQLRERQRESGNTMEMAYMNPNNPSGSMYALNAAVGAEQNTRRLGSIFDSGSPMSTSKYGGSTKYQQGGTYKLSEEDIQRIIQMGGEVEYLD